MRRLLSLIVLTAAPAFATCGISEAELSCQDSVNVASVATASKLSWSVTPTGTPAAAARMRIALCASPQ